MTTTFGAVCMSFSSGQLGFYETLICRLQIRTLTTSSTRCGISGTGSACILMHGHRCAASQATLALTHAHVLFATAH